MGHFIFAGMSGLVVHAGRHNVGGFGGERERERTEEQKSVFCCVQCQRV